MTATKNNLLLILERIHELCIRNGIHYSLHGGTLLGAVRNGGFIPWDDDADISMTRHNFEKFRRIVREKDNPYHLGMIPCNQVPKVVLLNDDSPSWVDIMVYDYISDNPISQRIKIMLLTITIPFVKAKGAEDISKTILNERALKRFVYNGIFFLGSYLPIEVRLQIRELIEKKLFVGRKRMIHKSCDQYKGILEIFPKEVMQHYQLMSFEDTILMVSKDYRKFLLQSYGEDYMTPRKPEEQDVRIHTLLRQYVKMEKERLRRRQ